ncbi:hypothetical protein D9619_003847 [Psilocybe cf. subviscida]|uniref:Uncharacterized protein n=1 Tax=Psilocybe cf. subviscida TaxID=2480587 RepID=A0A8H5ETN8_9AGAR|nr:hypothetical protein D9619_003847 [Psilocybe cf. subviscida]
MAQASGSRLRDTLPSAKTGSASRVIFLNIITEIGYILVPPVYYSDEGHYRVRQHQAHELRVEMRAINLEVDTLRFAIGGSKHDLLGEALRSFATGLIKQQIQK